MTWIRTGVFAAILSLLASPALSHEGHSHGDEAPPTTVITAPRATVASTLFELVAVADGPARTIYIDRLGTNEPVTGGTVSVETPAGPATAAVDGDIYLLEAPWATEPGELLVTVEAGADIAFLTATLTIPAAAAAAPASAPGVNLETLLAASSRSEALKMAALGGTGFLFGLAVMALRRRRVLAAGVAVVVLAVWSRRPSPWPTHRTRRA